MDILGSKLEILTAAFDYADAQYELGKLSRLKMNDPKYVTANKLVNERFTKLHEVVNKLSLLTKEN